MPASSPTRSTRSCWSVARPGRPSCPSCCGRRRAWSLARRSIATSASRSGPGCRPAAPAGNELLCRMDLQLYGILRVTAMERRTGLGKHITIEGATPAMTSAQVAESQRRMQDLFGDAGDVAEADLDEEDVANTDADEAAAVAEATAAPVGRSSEPAPERADEV